jgi:hypothetical protein
MRHSIYDDIYTNLQNSFETHILTFMANQGGSLQIMFA